MGELVQDVTCYPEKSKIGLWVIFSSLVKITSDLRGFVCRMHTQCILQRILFRRQRSRVRMGTRSRSSVVIWAFQARCRSSAVIVAGSNVVNFCLAASNLHEKKRAVTISVAFPAAQRPGFGSIPALLHVVRKLCWSEVIPPNIAPACAAARSRKAQGPRGSKSFRTLSGASSSNAARVCAAMASQAAKRKAESMWTEELRGLLVCSNIMWPFGIHYVVSGCYIRGSRNMWWCSVFLWTETWQACRSWKWLIYIYL